jgi:WD40 repeat protein
VDANLILFYYYDGMRLSLLFNIDSFTDWQSLIQCLKTDNSPDKDRVRSFLDAKTLEKITAWKPGDPVDESIKNLIIEDFNQILKRRDFYKSEVFKGIELSEDDKLQLKAGFKDSSTSDIIKFNRSLFEKIFSHEMSDNYFYLINLGEKSKTRLNIHPESDGKIKNFRWSPDGKKIGIIDYKGRLYIYDIEKKTTVKVNEDPDCFDFFWVE